MTVTIRDLLKAIADCDMDARIDIRFRLREGDVVEGDTDYHPESVEGNGSYLQIDCEV